LSGLSFDSLFSLSHVFSSQNNVLYHLYKSAQIQTDAAINQRERKVFFAGSLPHLSLSNV